MQTARWFMGALMLGLLAWVIEGYSKSAAYGFVFLVIFIVLMRNTQVIQWIFARTGGM